MGILPDGVGIAPSLDYVDLPTNTFLIHPSNNQISGMDSGLAAMRQAIDIILHTERFRWQIYNSNFGVEMEGLVGEEAGYIQSELPRRIEDAFSVDRRILSVDNFIFSEDGAGNMTVAFDVETVYGTVREEMTVNGS